MKTKTPARAHDIRFICRHMSTQNLAEVMALGLSFNEVSEHLLKLSRLPTGYSEVETNKGVAVAVFGLRQAEDGFNNTWFIATQEFFETGTEGLWFARQRVKHLRAKLGLPLRSTSYSPRDDAERWFRALGFREVERRVDGGRVFIYK